MTEKITSDSKRWSYEWNANGSLRTVTRPDLRSVYFEYDALGRRTSKFFDRRVTRWVWDGNTPLHEWSYGLDDRPRIVKDEYGFDVKDKPEPVDNVITWVFEEGTFKPTAKLTAAGNHSIVTDHLGTPAQMYDGHGSLTWDADFDIYGKVRNFAGSGSLSDCPFRYQGQYEDAETGLYYNRFRYYDPESGGYLSQDPIGLAGNNPTIYGYVHDPNSSMDLFGLYDVMHHTIPREIYNPRSLSTEPLLKGALAEHPDIVGRAGNPNRWAIPDDIHRQIHEGARGGKYNSAWIKEIGDLKVRKGRELDIIDVDDILKIRDKITKKFGIDKYKPCS